MLKLLHVSHFLKDRPIFTGYVKNLKHIYPSYPIIKSFFSFRFFCGYYALGRYGLFGCLKHWSLGMVCRYIFPKYSKKNIQTLFRLSGLYGSAITNKINSVRGTNTLFMNKTIFPEFVVNSAMLKQKTWGRLNKVKRSLPRRSRKKFFISKMGRIWLT